MSVVALVPCYTLDGKGKKSCSLLLTKINGGKKSGIELVTQKKGVVACGSSPNGRKKKVARLVTI